jgi:hypothetical protein
MLECHNRRNSGSSHLDALHARVRDAGGGSDAVAKVLYEVGEELDAAEQNDEQDEDAEQEVAKVYEEFFMKERDEVPADFRPSRT